MGPRAKGPFSQPSPSRNKPLLREALLPACPRPVWASLRTPHELSMPAMSPGSAVFPECQLLQGRLGYVPLLHAQRLEPLGQECGCCSANSVVVCSLIQLTARHALSPSVPWVSKTQAGLAASAPLSLATPTPICLHMCYFYHASKSN